MIGSRLRPSLLAAAATVLAGCGGGEEPQATTPTLGDVPAACERFVPRTRAGSVPDLVDPPSPIVVGEVSEGADATHVTGYVAMTPDAFLAAYRRDRRVTDGESEGFEAEVAVADGDRRVYWKLRRVCASGSAFLATMTE